MSVKEMKCPSCKIELEFKREKHLVSTNEYRIYLGCSTCKYETHFIHDEPYSEFKKDLEDIKEAKKDFAEGKTIPLEEVIKKNENK